MSIEALERRWKAKRPPADSAPEPAPAGSLDQLVDQMVEARVKAILTEEQKQPQRRSRHLPDFDTRPEYTSFEKVPEPPRTAPLKDMTVQVERNELRRIAFITIGKTRFAVQRDSEGLAVRLVPTDQGIPPTPATQPSIPERN